MNFVLSKEENTKIQEWLSEEVYPTIIQWQKKRFKNPDHTIKLSWEDGYPYMGAIAGGLTYSFTPTSLGVVCKVEHWTPDPEWKKFKLDLTDYNDW